MVGCPAHHQLQDQPWFCGKPCSPSRGPQPPPLCLVPSGVLRDPQSPSYDHNLTFRLEEREVRRILRAMDSRKTAGPDDIPPTFDPHHFAHIANRSTVLTSTEQQNTVTVAPAQHTRAALFVYPPTGKRCLSKDSDAVWALS